MQLIYGVSDKPKFGQTIVFAFQQMIAIMAATLLVPMLMSGYGLECDPAAALFGAGAGTIVYLLFTKRRSPVFLGSSFTFLGAYSAVIGMNYGYLGVMIGVGFAGLVYVAIALIIKLVGSNWVNKIMPPVIIGPIVAIIGLSLSGTATSWISNNGTDTYSLLNILIGVVTFLAIAFVSIRGTKTMKLIPFIIGIGVGYVFALILTIIGNAANVEMLKIMDLSGFKSTFVDNFGFTSFFDYPKFTFLKVIQTASETPLNAAAIGNIAITFIPIGVVELAQHIADHKNLSSIIEQDLITDPGLSRTLLGDGVGSIVGGIFGGCANTTYGESIGCVAITKNASIVTIATAAAGCMILSFFTPFVVVINSIPKCVMGGACVAMYGFIAVSGLQMLKQVDLSDNANLYVVCAIFVIGIGGLSLNFGTNSITGGALIQVTSLATALIVGLITKVIVSKKQPAETDKNGFIESADHSKDETEKNEDSSK